MPSPAQLSANASNAQHSTGPRSPEGKAASSLNNLRHGFRSQSVLLPGDDPAEYDALLANLTTHFGPGDLSEVRHVREMADAEWRLRRVRAQMESALTRRIDALKVDHPEASAIELQSLAIETLGHAAPGGRSGPSYSTWLRYESKFERQYERAYDSWHRYQNVRERANAREAKATEAMLHNAIFGPLPPLSPETEAMLSAQAATRATVVRGSTKTKMASNVHAPLPPDHPALQFSPDPAPPTPSGAIEDAA